MFDLDRLADIGKRIRDTRVDKDMTQKELEKKAQLSNTSLSKFENKTQSPTIEQLAKIAKVLEVDIEFLLGIDKDTDFIDDFIDLFLRLTTTNEYLANNGGVYKGEDLIFGTEKEYLVLTGNGCVFTLITKIAAAKNSKSTLLSAEYKSRLNAAKDEYKKSKAEVAKSKEESYFLISRAQMTEIIESAVIHQSYVETLFKEIGITTPLEGQPLPPLKLNTKAKNEEK